MDTISPAALRKVTRELYGLQNDPPEGIRLVEHQDSISDINAWILGPGYFVTKIFHPNVSKQGEVCVSTLKKDWQKDLGLKHILLVVKCLLIVPNPESALNEEAGRQLLERYDDYAKHARLMTSIHARSNVNDIFPRSTRTRSTVDPLVPEKEKDRSKEKDEKGCDKEKPAGSGTPTTSAISATVGSIKALQSNQGAVLQEDSTSTTKLGVQDTNGAYGKLKPMRPSQQPQDSGGTTTGKRKMLSDETPLDNIPMSQCALTPHSTAATGSAAPTSPASTFTNTCAGRYIQCGTEAVSGAAAAATTAVGGVGGGGNTYSSSSSSVLMQNMMGHGGGSGAGGLIHHPLHATTGLHGFQCSTRIQAHHHHHVHINLQNQAQVNKKRSLRRL
ncbi:hypothetical protein BGW38_000276 [Lunasporangiospora selenospora]|uniref:UBC core domain-containing protein n=1 Tax=Lunasporangiospora selenospora TaxID=979761 RepID=A0A9P6KF46_9FUNG|nr:hypothetical protein BGW38_000276 [Lunasporangiospora selenospora]